VLEGAWPGLSKPSTYSIVESGNGMEQAAHSDADAEDEVDEPTPLTTTVKRLTSTGDVLLEQVPHADQGADGLESHWPWADVRSLAEDAFKGSDGGLSSVTVTLEAESQVWCTCLKGSAPHSHLLAPLGSLGRSYASLE